MRRYSQEKKARRVLRRQRVAVAPRGMIVEQRAVSVSAPLPGNQTRSSLRPEIRRRKNVRLSLAVYDLTVFTI